MKKIYLVFTLITSLVLHNCIAEDTINDTIPEEIRFLNAVENISLSEDPYQLNAKFFNSTGKEETANISWSSSDPSVATVSDSGLLTSVSVGTTTIKALITTNDKTIEETISLTITKEEVEETQDPIIKSGTIITTSSYVLEGNFTLSEIKNSNNLELSISSNYRATTSLPGLYVYLSNNPNSISNALEIGPVTTFSGAHAYTINNKGINDYSHVLYWCKPFGVKVGQGEINN